MENRFTELYGKEDIPRLKNKALVWLLISGVIGLITLGIIIGFCVSAYHTETNELLPSAIVTSIIGGFIVITLYRFIIVDIRAELRHTEAILDKDAETEVLEGEFTLTNERLFIKKGVPIVRVVVKNGDETRSLQVFDKKKKLLPGKITRVRAVYGFITAFEEAEHDSI